MYRDRLCGLVRAAIATEFPTSKEYAFHVVTTRQASTTCPACNISAPVRIVDADGTTATVCICGKCEHVTLSVAPA